MNCSNEDNCEKRVLLIMTMGYQSSSGKATCMVSLFWKAYFYNISETQRETTLIPINTVNTSAGKPQKAATMEGAFSELRDLDEATQTTKLGFLM